MALSLSLWALGRRQGLGWAEVVSPRSAPLPGSGPHPLAFVGAAVLLASDSQPAPTVTLILPTRGFCPLWPLTQIIHTFL